VRVSALRFQIDPIPNFHIRRDAFSLYKRIIFQVVDFAETRFSLCDKSYINAIKPEAALDLTVRAPLPALSLKSGAECNFRKC
jgi:hypothetical protein